MKAERCIELFLNSDKYRETLEETQCRFDKLSYCDIEDLIANALEYILTNKRDEQFELNQLQQYIRLFVQSRGVNLTHKKKRWILASFDREPYVNEDDEPRPSLLDIPENYYDAEQKQISRFARLYEILQVILNDDEMQLFEMRFRDGLTFIEMGNYFGVYESTVRRRYQSVLDKIQFLRRADKRLRGS